MPCTRFSALRQGSSRTSTAILISLPPRAILADLDEHLAEVLAAQQADERLGRLLEALDDVLAVLQLALAQPARAVGEELRHPVGVIADDEAANGDAVDEHRRQVRPRRHLRGVVLGDDAAERDARERVDVFQYGLQHVAADVVEVHVDAVRTGVAQHGPEFRHAVGHASVEVEVLEHVLALLPGGGDPDRAAAADLRELADDGADGAGGGGDDDRLAGLGLADVVEADVRGHARHAEDAGRGGDRRRLGIELERAERPHARAAALRHVVGLPAAVGQHEVARPERGVARLHHLADGAADHRLPELDGRGVGLHVVHPPPHVGIQRQPDGAHEDLAVLRRGHRRVDHLEIGRFRLADGAVPEQHAAVRHGRDCRPAARPLQPPGPSAIVPAMTATTRLAEFVVKTSLRDCPDAVLAQTRRAALDSIGVMLAGASEPVARSAPASRLLGLDVTQPRHALGIAASMASGLKENLGSMTKPSHAGHAAQSGIRAAQLAREGLTASDAALEGRQGYVAAFSGATLPADALDRLGTRWELTASGIAVKPYPSCALTHSAIDALLELRARHRIDPAKVAAVEVGVNAVVPDVLRHARPSNGLERKFSMQYCAAAPLARGAVGLADFEPGPVPDTATRDPIERVRMVVDPALPNELEQHAWSRVTVRLADGTTLESTPRGAAGHPATPLSDAELHAKFLGCAVPVLGADAAEGVAEQIRRLEDVPDVRALTSRLVAEQE